MEAQKSYFDDFMTGVLTETRLKYLPLMWEEAKYHEQGVDLYFNVFDPYHQFQPDLSLLQVSQQNHLFDYQIVDNFVKLFFSLTDVHKFDISAQLLSPQKPNIPYAEISFSFYPDLSPKDWKQSWFIPLQVESIKLPNPERLFRVIGDTRTSSYLVGGGDQAMKISLLIQRSLNLSFKNHLDVLDWGCGCGRITQFLSHFGISNLVGADIDQDNIQWCKENIKGVTFTSLPFYPPTDFADNSFDVIIGVSVMTHLTEDTHKQWLQEIKRILRPGGFALLSVRGLSYYHVFPGITNEILAKIEQEGYIDMAQDPALNEVISDQEYYRATFCSRHYVRQMWREYFYVIDIVDGLVLQDMVILQKPQ